MGNHCCSKVQAESQSARKDSAVVLAMENGGRTSVSGVDVHSRMMSGGLPYHPHADIIRQPNQSPMRQGSVLGRMESPNGIGTMMPRMLIALYDYNAREISDMSFRKGDRMELLDDSDADWWKAEHIPTAQVGYIPRNFVAMEQSVESYE